MFRLAEGRQKRIEFELEKRQWEKFKVQEELVHVESCNPDYYIKQRIEAGPKRVKSVDPNKSLFDCSLEEINFLIRKQQAKLAEMQGYKVWDYRPKKQR